MARLFASHNGVGLPGNGLEFRDSAALLAVTAMAERADLIQPERWLVWLRAALLVLSIVSAGIVVLAAWLAESS